MSYAAGLASRASDVMRRETLPVWFGALLVLALWLLARPYVGLRHDGILYAGQALLQLLPATMTQDIFFEYGSQDRFSLVSRALAGLYPRWGVDAVQMVVPTLCQLALMVTAYRLMRSLPTQERWLGLAAVAVLSHIYGGHAIFSFGERFLTGRTVAEPLAFAALLLLLHGRWLPAGLCVVATALLHPLVALPVVVIGWIHLCLQDRRWGWAAVSMAVPLALGVAGVVPFTGLFATFDETWWAAVVKHNGHVLVSLWLVADWQIVVLDLAVLAGASRLLAGPIAGLARATLIGSIVLICVSAIGADLFRNILVTQLQLWRVLWVAHFLGLLCLPALAIRTWRQGAAGRLAALSLAATVVAVNSMWEGGWVFLAWTGFTLALIRVRRPLSATVHRVATAATCIALIGLSTAVTARTMGLLQRNEAVYDVPTLLLVAFTLPTLAMPVAGGMLWAWQRGRAAATLAAALLLATAAYGAASWDRRSPWTRYIESSFSQEHPFSRLIPANAQVYWHDDPSATWLSLKRASYVSVAQAAGLLFNRQTAVEFTRRQSEFAPLELQVGLCKTMAAMNGDQHDRENCMPTEELVEVLCQVPRGPDFLIFERKLLKGVIAEWIFEPEAEGEDSKKHYLYDCAQLR